jgi:Flp pilus assembly protein TadG
MIASGLARFVRSRRGNTAAEFALVLPGMLFLIFGAVNLCIVVYAAVNLHSAVEGGARYASVTTASGATVTSTSVSNYVTGHYKGPGLGMTVACTPTNCSASGCGHTVTATGSYKVSYGFGAVTVPLSATACFP